MRLIDADALKVDHIVGSTTTNTECYRYVSKKQIDEAPTVDAVPIEFIKERISYLNELIDYEINEQGDWNGRSMHGQSELKLLLREWRTRDETD